MKIKETKNKITMDNNRLANWIFITNKIKIMIICKFNKTKWGNPRKLKTLKRLYLILISGKFVFLISLMSLTRLFLLLMIKYSIRVYLIIKNYKIRNLFKTQKIMKLKIMIKSNKINNKCKKIYKINFKKMNKNLIL